VDFGTETHILFLQFCFGFERESVVVFRIFALDCENVVADGGGVSMVGLLWHLCVSRIGGWMY
jgi:hypothetical protein